MAALLPSQFAPTGDVAPLPVPQRALVLRVVLISLGLAAVIALAGWAGVLPGASRETATWAQALPVLGSGRRWQPSRWAPAADGSALQFLPELAPAEARRDRSLPYLFDAAAQPTVDEACGHCSNKQVVPDPKDRARAFGNPTGKPMLCCGVCQYEDRHCAHMAPPGAMRAHLEQFKQQGFDFDAFTPEELWSRLKGHTLWLIGDSQTWHWYYAVECFMRRYAVDLERRRVTSERQMVQELTPVTWPIYVPPSCIHLRDDTRICAVRSDNGDDLTQHVLPALQKIHGDSLASDILVLNFGLHFDVRKDREVYIAHIDRVAAYVNQHKAQLPTLVWMTTPVQHFPTANGRYSSDKVLGKPCQPLTAWYEGDWEATQGGPYNSAAAKAIVAAGWPVLDTWNATVPLWDLHKTGECTHWCSPSAYHLWLYLLNGLLRDNRIGNMLPDGVAFQPL